MYFLFELLRPVFFVLRLIGEIKDKLYYLGMPSKVDPFWEWYELRSPEEKFPELLKQEEKITKEFNFRKGSIFYIIFNLLHEEVGEWVSIQRLINATGKDAFYIRIVIGQIKKKVKPYKIEASGKGSYRLIIS